MGRAFLLVHFLAELPLSFSDDKTSIGPRGVPSTPKERENQDVSADDGYQHQCPPSQAGTITGLARQRRKNSHVARKTEPVRTIPTPDPPSRG
jgi:hypothetical protein